MTDADLASRLAIEIHRLHDVLVTWFNGTTDPDRFDEEVAEALHPDFVWVSPSGADISRKAMLDGLRSGHGANPDFAITVEDIEMITRNGDMAVVVYTEHQTGAKNAPAVNTRRSTVVFSLKPRLQWRYLHETYRV